MFKVANRLVVVRCLVVFCALALVVTSVVKGAPAAPLPPSLESLLKAAHLPYTTVEGGAFKVVFTDDDGNATTIIAQEKKLGDSADALKMGTLYCMVTAVPNGFKHPSAMLQKICEINDNLTVGKLSIGSGGHVFYSSSFWLSGADATIVGNEMALAHFTRIPVDKALKPYVTE